MNPPSAISGAMNRDRKPFTYTPGGLDLSEIKSERMAKRLMRNAMNQGVPEHSKQNTKSPSSPSTTVNVPNFNCLPVQVFPTFPLPANPKSLLRTRSNPDQPREPPLQKITASEQIKDSAKPIGTEQIYKSMDENASSYSVSADKNYNSNRPLSLFECSTAPSVGALPITSYGSDGHTIPCYLKFTDEIERIDDFKDVSKYSTPCPLKIDKKKVLPISELVTSPENSIYSLTSPKSNPVVLTPNNCEENAGIKNEQKEVKVVKKNVKRESASEDNNEIKTEDQNGDANIEATVKLPSKKSAAKIETKVEVLKKVLADGSIEEVKTTTTRTTIDGKTEVTTKTETTIIPKEEEADEEVVEEEQEEEEEEQEKSDDVVVQKQSEENNAILENNSDEAFIKQDENVETTTTKKVTILQSSDTQEESEEEIEEEEEDVVEENVEEKQSEDNINKEELEPEDKKTSNKDEDGEQISNEEEIIENGTVNEEEQAEPQEQVDEEEYEEDDSDKQEKEKEIKVENKEDNEEQNEKEENEEEYEEVEDKENSNNENIEKDDLIPTCESTKQVNEESQTENEMKRGDMTPDDGSELKIELSEKQNDVESPKKEVEVEHTVTINIEKTQPKAEQTIPLREPSVPLEKVEDVEIKPIGQIISKSHTENTEIITTSLDKPITGKSMQTEYNRIENIVTVNRTTKTLDQAYNQISQQGIPTVKSYFSPHIDNISATPQSTRPYQPVYPSQQETERRHSLLLDRLSIDRQIPTSDIYQNNYQLNNQNYEQNQWLQEPQSEVLTVSNVKPSTITKNQQWYQQATKEEVTHNNVVPSINVPSQQWIPQQSQPQTQMQAQPQVQTQYQPQPPFQQQYTDNTYKTSTDTSNIYQQSNYPSYTSKPLSWVGSNTSDADPVSTNTPANQFSYLKTNTSENYQKTSQQFTPNYVPPPWEQDSTYQAPSLYQTYQPSNTTTNFPTGTNQSWKPPPPSKFSKPAPTSYIPPAPNQSFVKPVSTVNSSTLPGRKTYYSEYERRYITVPESTYIPSETKYQAQPDPSPQYYYDNNEPIESVEPEWRKELREFTEKSQTQNQSEQTSVKPPWEEDPKYYVPKVTTEYTPTPTWSQTLRPSSWRERSFESDYVGPKEWPKSNTLGRGRPQSSYIKSNIAAPIPERPRGVSVDRYNPNNYTSPIPPEYPPVQGHVLNPPTGAKTYHNPHVPAYHARTSAEHREQSPAIPQPRQWRESRASPLQSRSFKYLQWITGTEN